MQRQVTIELLAGRVTNDVLYIHPSQVAITHIEEDADQVLADIVTRLWREP